MNESPLPAADDLTSDGEATLGQIQAAIDSLSLGKVITAQELHDRHLAALKARIVELQKIFKTNPAAFEGDVTFQAFIAGIQPVTDVDDLNTRLMALQCRIIAWSTRNFGDNAAKNIDCRIHLQYIAPLLGVVEELAEYAAANDTLTFADALADTGIYLLDYAARTGVAVAFTSEQYRDAIADSLLERFGLGGNTESSTVKSVLVPLGKLIHINLKAVQGIRGYDYNNTKFNEENIELIHKVFLQLASACTFTLLPLMEFVFNRVSARDWVKNPERAGQPMPTT